MVEDLASGLIAMGHKVLIVARIPKNVSAQDSESRVFVPVKNVYDMPDVSQNLIANRLILRKLNAYKTPDIIGVTSLGSFAAAHIRAQHTKARLVYFANLPFGLHRYVKEEQLNQSWLWSGRIENLSQYEQKIAHTADLVVVAGKAMKEFVAQEYRLPNQHLFIAPHYVRFPTNSYPTNSLTHRILQEQKKNKRYILFAGRLVPQKGLHILLKAFQSLLESYSNIQLIIAGTGERGETIPGFYQSFTKRECISFLGQIPRNDLPALYDIADIVVIPSIFEPFGLVCREAMARARPIIASDVDGLSEAIEHGVNGKLVAIEKDTRWHRYLCPKRLAKAIQYFLEFPCEAQKEGIAAKQTFETTWGNLSILTPLVKTLKTL